MQAGRRCRLNLGIFNADVASVQICVGSEASNLCNVKLQFQRLFIEIYFNVKGCIEWLLEWDSWCLETGHDQSEVSYC